MKRHIVFCNCESVDHQVVLQYDPDYLYGYNKWSVPEMEMHLHLAPDTFFRRVRTAFRYIFRYQCDGFTEIDVSIGEVKRIRTFMQEFLHDTAEARVNRE